MNLFEIITVFIYGSTIEPFCDEQGNETEMVAMKTGSDMSDIIMNKWLKIRLISNVGTNKGVSKR